MTLFSVLMMEEELCYFKTHVPIYWATSCRNLDDHVTNIILDFSFVGYLLKLSVAGLHSTE
jgi:hypothetical protein